MASKRIQVGVATLLALGMTACAASQTPPIHREEAVPQRASPSPFEGTWHLEALPPEPATQLTHGCYEFLGLVHYSDPQLMFSGERIHVRAQSVGNLLTWSDDWFDFTREGDQLRIDTSRWTLPPSALIPCGAIPDSLTISPSSERLLANVAHCPPCAHEAAIDGIVGLTFVRTP